MTNEELSKQITLGVQQGLQELCKQFGIAQPKTPEQRIAELEQQVAEMRAAAERTAKQPELEKAKAEAELAETLKKMRLTLIKGGQILPDPDNKEEVKVYNTRVLYGSESEQVLAKKKLGIS